ncbi:hypothetical protein [Pseudodesulfovibrio sediminis]|uniref:Uncharacterized protein n=1 Tax=Pseudodesulfovibrio sediminis TaxID=2810563 RepID=A0ABM7P3D4_9BACT|nr:hypothetical protein [Pseudodesulfovibrio sediminis]BCS87358.1 hypothetical protein PSDVSF_06000 [Pseudodesulfovibrio sediminis]
MEFPDTSVSDNVHVASEIVRALDALANPASPHRDGYARVIRKAEADYDKAQASGFDNSTCAFIMKQQVVIQILEEN